MKNISGQYQDLLEGKMTQAQFLRNARMMFPNYVTNHNSFQDSVKILKTKGMLVEGDAVKGTPDKEPTYDYPTQPGKYKKVEQSPEVDEQDGIYPATTLTDIPKEKVSKPIKSKTRPDGLEDIKDNDTKNEMKKVKVVKENIHTHPSMGRITDNPQTNVKTPPKGQGDYDPKARAASLARLQNMGPKKDVKETQLNRGEYVCWDAGGGNYEIAKYDPNVSWHNDEDVFHGTYEECKRHKQEEEVNVYRFRSNMPHKSYGQDYGLDETYLNEDEFDNVLKRALESDDSTELKTFLKTKGKEAIAKIKAKLPQLKDQARQKIAKWMKIELDEARFKKGTNIGKKGPGFAKIEKAAEKQYGSEEAGKRVAGAILKKVLNKESDIRERLKPAITKLVQEVLDEMGTDE